MRLSEQQLGGPTQSLQVTRRTWAISLPVVYARPQGSGLAVRGAQLLRSGLPAGYSSRRALARPARRYRLRSTG